MLKIHDTSEISKEGLYDVIGNEGLYGIEINEDIMES